METKTKMEDYEKQTAKFRALFETVEDKANWKNPTRIRKCADRAEAEALAEAISYFCGGAEIGSDNEVMSRGYYFYVGA
jgi:mRNA-degrading endonuclease HigB of HigAB toxin-antitoxin module